MKKTALRNLGIGFLTSALITGGYETFVRGNAPIEGMTVQSIFNNNEELVTQQESQIAEYSLEVDNFKQEIDKMTKASSTIDKKNQDNEKQIESLQKVNASLVQEYGGNLGQDDESQNEPTVTSENSDQDQTFTITVGASSAEISQQLADQGLINDAKAFQQLIDDWDLNEYIQANDYQLTTDMTMDEILSTITNGAYYY